MPKSATETKTKSATKAANTKTKADKPVKDDKTRRAPSAYNQFMKDHLADYKEKHPDLNHKEAFSAVASMWKDAPENPKGKTASKKGSEKENAESKTKSRPKKPKAPVEDEAENEEEEPSNEE